MRALILLLIIPTFVSLLLSQEVLNEQTLNEYTKNINHICVHEVADLISAGENIMILDIRSEAAFSKSHLAHAVWMPQDSLKSRAKEWFKDDEILYLLYCQGGRKSATATYYMSKMGYKAKNIVGGMNAMMKAKMSIVPSKARGMGKSSE